MLSRLDHLPESHLRRADVVLQVGGIGIIGVTLGKLKGLLHFSDPLDRLALQIVADADVMMRLHRRVAISLPYHVQDYAAGSHSLAQLSPETLQYCLLDERTRCTHIITEVHVGLIRTLQQPQRLPQFSHFGVNLGAKEQKARMLGEGRFGKGVHPTSEYLPTA